MKKTQLIFDFFADIEERQEEIKDLKEKFLELRTFDYQRAFSRSLTKKEKTERLENITKYSTESEAVFKMRQELLKLKYYRISSFHDCVEFAHDIMQDARKAGKTKNMEFDDFINLEKALTVTALYCVFNDYTDDFVFTEESFCELLEDDDRFIEAMKKGIDFVKIVEKTASEANADVNFEVYKTIDLVSAFNNVLSIAEFFRDKFDREIELRKLV